MAESTQPVLQRIIQGCSRFLLFVGAVIFLVGDRFLHEIKHVDFLFSEVAGILAGVLLMLLGAGIAVVSKSPRPEQKND